MSLNAFAIMLKPFLSKYLEPLEENGTIAKLQQDITLIAQSNAIPELAVLVSELQTHNRIMARLCTLLDKAAYDTSDERSEPGSDTAAAGLIGNHTLGLPELSGTD